MTKRLAIRRYHAVTAYAAAKKAGDTRRQHEWATEADRLTRRLMAAEQFWSNPFRGLVA
jgi:hypothetical protein